MKIVAMTLPPMISAISAAESVTEISKQNTIIKKLLKVGEPLRSKYLAVLHLAGVLQLNCCFCVEMYCIF